MTARAGWSRARVVVTAIVASTAVVVFAGPTPVVVALPAQDASSPSDLRPRYHPPVDAPVSDPFRAPPEPWAAGNRGLEYRTVPATPVRAIGPGVVSFAGPVAGARYVTVEHPDGLRSSYGPLATIGVPVRRRVAGGAVIGRAGDRLHLGVRRGETYLDPATLWGQPVGGGRAHLVPGPGRAVASGRAGAGVHGPPPAAPRSGAGRGVAVALGPLRARAGAAPGPASVASTAVERPAPP